MINKDLGYLLHKAAMVAKCNFSNQLNAFGITPGQFAVLREIYYCKKDKINSGISPACIAAKLEIDRPTASGIIDRLEAQGWVKRLDNPDDKRSFIIIATEKAVIKLKELEAISLESNKTIVNGFTNEEVDNFRSYLLRVKANFEKESSKL